MYWVYVLKSLRDNQLYVGRTADLRKRLEDHKRGKVLSTKARRPFKLVYCEASNDIKDADHREKYLKTTWGKRYLKHRTRNDSVI
ncbi:excinuclease ABC subunit C [Candidatus Giovannonibacteria bacterium RIFCSPHIGHO2_12_44_12]|uniref:Excinuclease ABC subunit C n=2 Tax=Candidatus Giovannoniibacteriota TaxID=1752738 RepID=A0A1F5WZ03_9BACT|nr:MAG: excinuclease ABC subunit C [Candidatus Giovannonibacteria bacterium RIFCSPHIGHO2_12_44_12]OGF85660.1 MAG: excinuclease ABC subunit C [Candidatus Giovannonibacteria bacterium RIFCSPLOWO2_02_44_8]